jgi:CBS-domain-containing membrane protein
MRHSQRAIRPTRPAGRHAQRGVTIIGWLFLLVPVAIVVYACIRLAPIYLNYMRVAKSIAQTASESRGVDSTNAQSLRVALEKHFDIEGITKPETREIDIHRDNDHWVVIADYEDLAPMFGNVSLLVQFHKEAEVRQ